MKVIIAGSRHIEDWGVVKQAIKESQFTITEVVSGGAAGVDTVAMVLAALHGKPLKVFMADWKRHGKIAGPIRNTEMANYADGLIAVWDGVSRGTKDMISKMQNQKKPVFIKIITPTEEE